jgi:hypothetical protein
MAHPAEVNAPTEAPLRPGSWTRGCALGLVLGQTRKSRHGDLPEHGDHSRIRALQEPGHRFGTRSAGIAFAGPWRPCNDVARTLYCTKPRYRSSTQPRSPRVRVIHDRNDSALAASDPWPGGGCCQRLNDRKVRSMTTAMTATTPTDSAHNSQPVGHNTEPRGISSSYAPRRSARRDRYSHFRHKATVHAQQGDPDRVSTPVASKAHVAEMAAMTARTVKTTPIAMKTGPKYLLLARVSASSSRCFFIVGSE